jgi:DNA primase
MSIIRDLSKSDSTGEVILCPFHEEKTGSMIIRWSEDTYHCLSCGKHGKASEINADIEKDMQSKKDEIKDLTKLGA